MAETLTATPASGPTVVNSDDVFNYSPIEYPELQF